MFKILPAIEEKFDMKEVDKATLNWLKWVMFGFVAIIMLATLYFDKMV